MNRAMEAVSGDTGSRIFSIEIGLQVLERPLAGMGTLPFEQAVALADRIGREFSRTTRALLRSGAESVVASLWKVSYDSTALLMTDFYERRARVPPKLYVMRLWLSGRNLNIHSTGRHLYSRGRGEV